MSEPEATRREPDRLVRRPEERRRHDHEPERHRRQSEPTAAGPTTSVAAPSDAIITVRDLQVEYKTTLGKVSALNGVTFDVPRGSVLGVVGESGSGKSVTARAIMQILERAGKITDGSIVFRRPPGDRRESTQHETELEAALDVG